MVNLLKDKEDMPENQIFTDDRNMINPAYLKSESRPSLILIIVCCLISGLFIYFIYTGIISLTLSTSMQEQYTGFSIIMLIASVVILILNITVVIKNACIINFNRRYEKYYNVLKDKPYIQIEELAALFSMEKYRIIDDLRKAISKSLIPQGRFSDDKLVFLATNQAYGIYLKDLENPNVYVKMRTRRKIKV